MRTDENHEHRRAVPRCELRPPRGQRSGESRKRGGPMTHRRAKERVLPLREQRRGQSGGRGGPMTHDPESRLSEAHHESLRLWLRLFTCTLLIERRVRA